MAVEVFYVVNNNGRIVHDTVYISKSRAQDFVKFQNDYNGKKYSLESASLDFVGRHVSQVQVYIGFDYTYDAQQCGMYDDITTTILFPSVELAKYSQLWQTFERKALADKESHNFYENKICSKDGPLDDWWYGDVMEGKFSMEIKRYKVDKRVN